MEHNKRYPRTGNGKVVSLSEFPSEFLRILNDALAETPLGSLPRASPILGPELGPSCEQESYNWFFASSSFFLEGWNVASPVGSVSGLLDRKFSRLGRGQVKVIKLSSVCIPALLLTCYATTRKLIFFSTIIASPRCRHQECLLQGLLRDKMG